MLVISIGILEIPNKECTGRVVWDKTKKGPTRALENVKHDAVCCLFDGLRCQNEEVLAGFSVREIASNMAAKLESTNM